MRPCCSECRSEWDQAGKQLMQELMPLRQAVSRWKQNHGLKVWIFPRENSPQESTHDCMSCKHRSVEGRSEEWQSNLNENLCFSGDAVANNEKD